MYVVVVAVVVIVVGGGSGGGGAVCAIDRGPCISSHTSQAFYAA